MLEIVVMMRRDRGGVARPLARVQHVHHEGGAAEDTAKAPLGLRHVQGVVAQAQTLGRGGQGSNAGTWLRGVSYLAVVIDLFSRRVVGWAMQSRQTTDVVLQALLMATWRRKPKGKVLIHSDQGSQFTSMDWAAFLRARNLEHSMSRRGNCHDKALDHCPRTNG